MPDEVLEGGDASTNRDELETNEFNCTLPDPGFNENYYFGK